jgi:hypothetical protein
MSTNIIFTRTNALILASATQSQAIPCLAVPATLYLPNNFTGADITFLAADEEDGIYTNPLKDNLGAIVKVVGAVAYDPISLDPGIFNGIQFLKIQTSVAQVTPVRILIVFTPVYGNYLS